MLGDRGVIADHQCAEDVLAGDQDAGHLLPEQIPEFRRQLRPDRLGRSDGSPGHD